MKKWVVLFSVVTAMQAAATPVLQQSVVKQAMAWMQEQPERSPENMKKYEAMTTTIGELTAELSKFQ